MKNKIILFSLLLTMLFVSCKNDKINIQNASEENISPTTKWMVVNVSYGTFKDEASSSGKIVKECRLGDVFQVEGKKIVKERNPEGRWENRIWYKGTDGWILENNVIILDTKLKAVSVSNDLLN